MKKKTPGYGSNIRIIFPVRLPLRSRGKSIRLVKPISKILSLKTNGKGNYDVSNIFNVEIILDSSTRLI